MMMNLVRVVFVMFLFSCTTSPTVAPTLTLHLSEINPDKLTHLTAQHLVHLSKIFDLEPFLYSKKIYIQTAVTAKHYPVITLNTRFAHDPEKLLSVFLHEQFHWWLIRNPKKARAVIKRLKITYPKVKDHIHLIVCYLEYRTVNLILGAKTTERIFQDFVNKDKIFPWFYHQILNKDLVIRKSLLDMKLMPPELN